MPTSIIDIDIKDEKFKKFIEFFNKFQEDLNKLPAEWAANNAAAAAVVNTTTSLAPALTSAAASGAPIPGVLSQAQASAAGVRKEVDLTTAALIYQTEILREGAREQAKARAEAAQAAKERAAESKEKLEAARQYDKMLRERRKEETDHRRAAEATLKDSEKISSDMLGHAQSVAKIFGGAAGGILAAGSITGMLTGLFEAASRIGGERTAAQSLGATAGQVKAFQTNFGRIGLDPSFLGSVRDMANDPSRSALFGQMDIPEEEVEKARRSGDYSTLTTDTIKAGKRIWDRQGPDGRSQQWLDTTGLGQGGLGMDLSHWGVIGAQSSEDIDQYSRQFQTDSQSMNLPDSTQKSYQDLSSSLSRLTGDIEKSFFGSGSSSYLQRAADDLDEIVKNKGWTGLLNTAITPPASLNLPHKWTLPGLFERYVLGRPDEADAEPASPAPNRGSMFPKGSFLDRWLGGGSAAPSADVARGAEDKGAPSRYSEQFSDLEDKFKLPHGLLTAIGMNESSLNANVAGTYDGNPKQWHKGMFQMSEDMLKKYGIDDPSNVDQVAPAAAKELSGYLEHFHGNVPAAIAAWHEGQGGVDRKMAQGGPDNGFLDAEPQANRDYVEKAIETLLRQQKEPVRVDVLVTNQSGANVHVAANAVAPQ